MTCEGKCKCFEAEDYSVGKIMKEKKLKDKEKAKKNKKTTKELFTHKMKDGTIMSGKTHTKGSRVLKKGKKNKGGY